jgi:hypothetical protein
MNQKSIYLTNYLALAYIDGSKRSQSAASGLELCQNMVRKTVKSAAVNITLTM